MLNLNFNPFPILETERLILRQLDIADANDLFLVRTHPVVMCYTHMQEHRDSDETAAFIEARLTNERTGEGIMWAIALKDTLKLIGTICYWNIQPENNAAEIGYILHPNHHREGIMNETIGKVIAYGFDTMKLHSIIADLDPENTASIKLLEKNGFIMEARFKNEYLEDTTIYKLLNTTAM